MNRVQTRTGALTGAAAVLLSCLTALSAAADDSPRTVTDDTLTYEVIDGGVKIVSADAGLTKLIIQKDFSGYPILAIGEYAFSDCGGLTSVEIRADLDTIETGAFSECSALKEINFTSGSVRTVGDGAFFDCEQLTSLNLPDTVTSIGDYAFGYCFSLTEFTLPASISAIPGYAFYYDDALEQVRIPEGITSIGGMAFIGCASLKTADFPASLTSIGDYAFVSCDALTSITVADGSSSFMTDASGVLLDAAGSKVVLYPAASGGTSYTVADSVTAIAPYAFSGAASLQEISVPDSVTEIGEGAFSNCRSLTQFTLPAKVTQISGTLFAESGLTSFTIPDTVTSIGDYAFYRCTALSEVAIPDSVTSVGSAAFFGCTGIREITVPDSVTEIGEYAIGFQYENNDSDSDVILLPDFTLRGSAKSAAKTYASENGVPFKQEGGDGNLLMIIVIGAVALLLVIVLLLSLLRRKQAQTAEDGNDAPAPPAAEEEEPDPNYTSILEGAEEDPVYLRAREDPFDRCDNSKPLSGEEREKLETEEFPND